MHIMKKICLIIIILFLSVDLQAQKSTKTNKKEKQPNNDELAAYQYQSERLVEYFAETLNFLGDSTTIAKERQIVTNESYLKIFRDQEVQIEDDLIEDRIVPMYKDVRAYLRDVGFFYKHVEFEYVIQEIKQFYNSRQEINFLVTVNRHLKGITVKNEPIENNLIRYIEIDLDHAKEVLKIISIYSTRLEEKEDVEIWWASLPNYWKEYFAKDIILDNGLILKDVIAFQDSSITLAYDARLDSMVTSKNMIILNKNDKPIKESYPDFFASITKKPADSQYVKIKYNGFTLHSIIGNMMKQVAVDIHGESQYSDLTPLSKMTYLNELDLSGTPISDLSDLRNLSNLIKLNISDTKITDLSPLQYLINLKEIKFNNTKVSNISSLSNNSSLEIVEMNNTLVSDIFPLARLTTLTRLKMNKTNVNDISALANNKNLVIISFHDTKVSSCEILKNFQNLEMVGMNNTKISDIQHLNGLKKLRNIFIENTSVHNISCLTAIEQMERIYCDGSKIEKKDAVEYMVEHPDVLVVFETELLLEWWAKLHTSWKTIWFEIEKLKEEPNKDQLHQIVIKKKLNLSNRKLTQIDCLSEMLMLNDLDISGNNITELAPLSNISTLITLNISNTKVDNISALQNNHQLETLIANEIPISEIESINGLEKLTLIECDRCIIKDANVDAFREKNPKCLVIYRTIKNQNWWNSISNNWKQVFVSETDHQETPNKYQLQNIINQEVINIKDNRSITSLLELQPFRFLKKLIIANTGIATLDDITDKTKLTYIDFSNNPVEIIDVLGLFVNLDTLIMENTQVKKLDIVAKCTKICYLNFSGTQVKNLKPLTNSESLISIDFNNTAVSSITPLLNLPHLKQMKAFRTKVTSGKIDEFKALHPDCEVIYY